MTLRELVKDLFNDLNDAVNHVVIYKDGRMWFGLPLDYNDFMYDPDYGYDILSDACMNLLEYIYEIDVNTINVNGYYDNINWHTDSKLNTIKGFMDGIKHQYEHSHCILKHILNKRNVSRETLYTVIRIN